MKILKSKFFVYEHPDIIRRLYDEIFGFFCHEVLWIQFSIKECNFLLKKITLKALKSFRMHYLP